MLPEPFGKSDCWTRSPRTVRNVPPQSHRRPPRRPPRAASDSQNPTRKSTGLLSELFSSSNRSQPTPASSQPAAKSGTRTSGQAAPAERPPADWEGIPFHEPRIIARSQSDVPIRDPSSPSTTRIIRGSSTRSIPAIPASARRDTRVIKPIPVPKTRVIKPIAPPTSTAAGGSRLSRPTTSESISTSESSRRTGRRSVGVLGATPAKSRSEPASKIADSGEDYELIPKVSRRELPSADESSDKETPPPTADKVVELAPAPAATAAKPAEKSVASQPTAQAEESESKNEPKQPAATRADVAAKSKTTPVTSPAEPDAASADAPPNATVPSEPIPTQADRVAVANTPRPPAPTLSPPTNLSPPSAPVGHKPYTTPSDEAGGLSNPVPVAGIPTHPYAASTPSAPISHRAGPPASEFQPRHPVPGVGPNPTPSSPTFNAAAAPIGSGLLPQLPQSRQDHAGAEAYVAGVPQLPRGRGHGQTAIGDLPAATTTVPLRDSAPLQSTRQPYAPIDPGFETVAPESKMREGATRRLKPGNTAVASELPGIRVVTHGPSEIMIRQTQQYEIRVENRGSIDAQGVMVRAMIPDWADVRGHNATQGHITPQAKNSESQDAFNIGTGERLVWTIDHLPAGSSEQMFVRLRAERSGSHGVDVDWTLVPQKSVTKVHVHEPQLSLVIDGPPEVTYGQSQTYKVRVMNPGDGVAPNVTFTLSPNSATPQTQRIGDIPAGKEAQFEVELTAQDLGDLKIHGLASGDLELRAEASKTIHVAAAKLEAIMNGPELKYQNTEGVYKLQIKNNGNAMTEQVVATLTLPGGAKYLGGISDSLQRGQVVKWTIDALAPGSSRDYMFRCNMASTGDQQFMFDCKGTAAAQTSVSIVTQVESIADLMLTIDDPVAPAPVSTEVAYEIVIRNRGSRGATDVRAIAQFSHGIEPKRLEGHSGEVLTGQVLFDPIPRIGCR